VAPRSTADVLIAGFCITAGIGLLQRDRDFASIAAVTRLKLVYQAAEKAGCACAKHAVPKSFAGSQIEAAASSGMTSIVCESGHA
jgi:hypothetical protein